VTDAIPPVLDERRAALCRLAAEIATGSQEEWNGALAGARTAASDAEVEEVILQSYLFVGFPTVLNVLGVWRRHASPPPGRPDEGLHERVDAGTRLCRRVYGPVYDRLREHIAALHPDLDRWMIEEGYGKTLSRPGLTAVDRELCVVAQLAASGQVPQLRSHLRGALNLGANPDEVAAALAHGLDASRRNRDRGRADSRELRAAWDEVRARAERAGSGGPARPDGADTCS
jgi:4-carboxymuconolactone decarboxylase